MLTYSEECAILDDIQEGAEIAMHREGYSSDAIDPIKVNKLAYFAIREFELNITFGWYKYGPAPVDTAIRQTTGGPSVTLDPKPASEIPASDRSRVPSQRSDHPAPERFADFFQGFDEFHTILQTETKEYLEEFYEQYAPEAYKPLYLASIRMQRKIDRIAEEPALVRSNDISYHVVSEVANEIYGELLQLPQLSEAAEPFRDYTNVLKDVLAAIESRDELNESVERFVDDFASFFYKSAWTYVALLISKDTVRGENRDRLLDSIDDTVSELPYTTATPPSVSPVSYRVRVFRVRERS